MATRKIITDLDLINSNQIKNMLDATDPQDAVTLSQMEAAIADAIEELESEIGSGGGGGGGGNDIFRMLSADQSGLNSNALQDLMPGISWPTVPAGKYVFEFQANVTRTTNGNNHSTTASIGGTATFSAVRTNSFNTPGTGSSSDYPPAGGAGNSVNARIGAFDSGFLMKSTVLASSLIDFSQGIYARGMLVVSSPGTIIPQFQYSATPGGVVTLKAGNYIHLQQLSGDV